MGLAWTTVHTPVGDLRLVANGARLRAVLWASEPPGRVALGAMTEDPAHPTLREAGRQLHDYFAGLRRSFELDLELGGTPFQQRVWEALRRIPYGEQRSYGALAGDLGAPRAARAVGAANGRNPLAVIVPCHRLIGTSGALRGFAGGLEAKETLLALESAAFRNRPRRGTKRFVPAMGFTPASWVTR